MTGPAQVPGPTVAPSAWASVRLIQGASKANQWQIDSSTSRAQLTVGADKACDWTVAADRVAAIHFELFWDGRRLWIADTHEAGGVTVDGGRLASWQPITGRARIEFGGAVMVAECSVPAVSVERPSVPPESIDLEPTRRPGGHAPGDDDERTTLHVRHESQGGPAGKQHGDAEKVPLHAAPTTISEMPEGAAPYGGPPPMPPGSGMSPPAILQSKMPVVAVPTIIAEPGRMPPGFPMPGPAGAGMQQRGGMGMSTPDPGRPPMMMPPGMPQGDPAAAMRPAMQPMFPPPGSGPMMTPTGRPPWMDRLGLPKTSMPPRTWGLIILTVAALMIVMFMGGDDKPTRQVARKKVAAAGDTGEGAQGKTKPAEAGAPGTQAGGATTGPGETKAAEGTAGGAAPGATQPEGTPPEGKTPEGKTPEGKTPEGKTPEGKTPEGKTPEGKTAEGKTAEGKTAEGKTPDGKTPEGKTPAGKTPEGKTAEGKTPAGKTPEGKTAEAGGQSPDGAALATAAQGADLLLAGRQREALAVYNELARRYPEQQGYTAIVKILKRRLAERCRDNKPGESPCPPAP